MTSRSTDCIFCRIVSREIPAEIVHEDENVIAFRDINPQAPVHVVVVPKAHIETLNDVRDPAVYAGVYGAIGDIVKKTGIRESGYRVVSNCRDNGGQTVYHIHFHVMGGRFMKWPPG